MWAQDWGVATTTILLLTVTNNILLPLTLSNNKVQDMAEEVVVALKAVEVMAASQDASRPATRVEGCTILRLRVTDRGMRTGRSFNQALPHC